MKLDIFLHFPPQELITILSKVLLYYGVVNNETILHPYEGLLFEGYKENAKL